MQNDQNQASEPSFSSTVRFDRANEQLALVSSRLKEMQKILRRDWAQLSPRERSDLSRRVKELEAEQKSLEDELEMNRPL